MSWSVEENARAVLLPAFDGLTLSDEMRRFLDGGGVSALFGESRSEYVARRMSDVRRSSETAHDIIQGIEAARARSGTLLAAIDQELGGICRLHDLVSPFPDIHSGEDLSEAEVEAACARVAQEACALGVNLFLAPVLDSLPGSNPWLEGRKMSLEPARAARLARAYVTGVQSAGVATCSKHFPGFASVTGDPALDPQAVCDVPLEVLAAGAAPFHAAIAAGTAMMMVGPAPVTALEPRLAALRTPAIIERLKGPFGFEGIVMADDLDAAATLRGDSVPHVAVQALAAGCDYLLLADMGTQLSDVVRSIMAAVDSGMLSEEELGESARRIRSAAHRFESWSREKASNGS